MMTEQALPAVGGPLPELGIEVSLSKTKESTHGAEKKRPALQSMLGNGLFLFYMGQPRASTISRMLQIKILNSADPCPYLSAEATRGQSFI